MSDGTEGWHPDNTSGFGVACRPGEAPRLLTPKPQPKLRPRTEYGYFGFRGEIGGPYCQISRQWLLGVHKPKRGITPGTPIG